MTLQEAIDTIFSHNEIVALWEKEDSDHHKKVWSGMAHQIPSQYLSTIGFKIFGLITDKISESDTINIKLN